MKVYAFSIKRFIFVSIYAILNSKTALKKIKLWKNEM